MTGEALTRLLGEALYLAVLLAAPPVLAALAAGLVMGLVQAATRVEERTLSTVPKLGAALFALAVFAPWIRDELVRFTTTLLAVIPQAGRP